MADAVNNGLFNWPQLPAEPINPKIIDYGNRYGTNTPKAAGYFGELPLKSGGVATEYSVGMDINGKNIEMPTLVPTLTPEEIRIVLYAADLGVQPPEFILEKARQHAIQRMNQGLSPFWALPEKQYSAQGNQNVK